MTTVCGISGRVIGNVHKVSREMPNWIKPVLPQGGCMKYSVTLRSKLDGKVWGFVENDGLTAQIEADYFVDFCEFELISIAQY